MVCPMCVTAAVVANAPAIAAAAAAAAGAKVAVDHAAAGRAAPVRVEAPGGKAAWLPRPAVQALKAAAPQAAADRGAKPE